MFPYSDNRDARPAVERTFYRFVRLPKFRGLAVQVKTDFARPYLGSAIRERLSIHARPLAIAHCLAPVAKPARVLSLVPRSSRFSRSFQSARQVSRSCIGSPCRRCLLADTLALRGVRHDGARLRRPARSTRCSNEWIRKVPQHEDLLKTRPQ